MPVDIPGFVYAAAVAAGGIMGYVKSRKFIMMFNILILNTYLYEFGIFHTNVTYFVFAFEKFVKFYLFILQIPSHHLVLDFYLAVSLGMELFKLPKILKVMELYWEVALHLEEWWAIGFTIQEKLCQLDSLLLSGNKSYDGWKRNLKHTVLFFEKIIIL